MTHLGRNVGGNDAEQQLLLLFALALELDSRLYDGLCAGESLPVGPRRQHAVVESRQKGRQHEEYITQDLKGWMRV